VIENPFAGDVAERYHRGRPRHHERTLRRVLPSGGSGIGLDVAGGTGLSTSALGALGFDAVCVDVALPMLALADGRRVCASAAHLPCRSGAASIVTVSSGVHWFDQAAFFAEALRVLRTGGLLVLYEHGFLGVPDDERFQTWSADVYRARYPTPPRGAYPTEVSPAGFTHVRGEQIVESIPFTQDALVDYFLTQSNTVGPVERGEETIESVRSWLMQETSVFFAAGGGGSVRDFSFWASIDVWSAGGQSRRSGRLLAASESSHGELMCQPLPSGSSSERARPP